MLFCQYDKTILIGDFNLTTDNKNRETFNLECLTNKLTCFKSENLSCIDLILTNKKELLKHSEVTQVEISYHHSFIVTSLKVNL